MQTLKDIAIEFAEDMYSGADDNDHKPGVLKQMKKKYISELVLFNPEGEQENISWEAGYLRGYTLALKDILQEINKSNNKLITAESIEYLLTN